MNGILAQAAINGLIARIVHQLGDGRWLLFVLSLSKGSIILRSPLYIIDCKGCSGSGADLRLAAKDPDPAIGVIEGR